MITVDYSTQKTANEFKIYWKPYNMQYHDLSYIPEKWQYIEDRTYDCKYSSKPQGWINFVVQQIPLI